MKRNRSSSKAGSARRMACTVSAASLMLGVSQAATVGLKFTVDYGLNNYVNYVNGPAFGVPMNNWQNLTGMPTGYHSGVGNMTFSLSETIDTTTSTNGLHPLPNGSLSVNWSGPMGNWSGFVGYDVGGPPQPIDSAPPRPEAQVYAGFIRDGVNFGPGSSGGDNNQPGYSIDITGLKSVFTNTPFVIELVAAADSMYHLTNAFVIDATHSVTQSVVYPNTQVYGDSGDTAWFRAIGGGLSTFTTNSVDADHVAIIGNRAQHSAAPTGQPKTDSINNGSTISGVIITDQPVITMQPQPKVAGPGDTIVWSAYAIGVPPLSLQWRKNGVPIPGATGTDFAITNIGLGDLAQYDLVVTNLYGSVTSHPVAPDSLSINKATNLVADAKTSGVSHDGLDFGAAWAATNTDGTTARTGVMQFTPTNQIVAPANLDTANATNGTIMFWMRSPGTDMTTGHTGGAGDGAMLVDYRTSAGLVIVQAETGNIFVQSARSAAFNDITSTATVSDNKWHHIAVTYGQTTSDAVTLYIDGQLDQQNGNNNGWSWPTSQEIEFGSSHDSYWQKYGGALDEVRFYNRILSGTEITSAKGGAVVDASALVLQYSFDAPPTSGVILMWQLQDVILQSTDTVIGPYQDLPSVLSPYPVVGSKTRQFYRYHDHTPTTIIANPYLM
jgi:hypothetical protein